MSTEGSQTEGAGSHGAGWNKGADKRRWQPGRVPVNTSRKERARHASCREKPRDRTHVRETRLRYAAANVCMEGLCGGELYGEGLFLAPTAADARPYLYR